MFRSFLPTAALALCLTGCATIPLPGKGFITPQSVRPVKPLMEGREGVVSQTKPDSKSKNPTPKPGAKKSTPDSKSDGTIPDSAIAPKLQEAEDKAASARSLSQSAQTEDDWRLIVQQWKRAIALLPTPAATSPLSSKVQQVRTTYTANLQSAQAQAQGSGKPTAIAPIEVDRSSSSRRGFILGTEASPSPSPSATPSDKPGNKPAEPPKNNPSPAPSLKN